MGVKERRTKILLSLVLLSDVDFKPVKIDERVQKIFDFSLNQKTKTTLSSLVKEGAIEQTGDAKDDEYALTASGLLSLSFEFPYFRFLKLKWDHKWRIISYEIPESKREIRDRLRREMQGWGLGPWHRSFWLTPHPVIPNLKELVMGKIEEQYIQAFESDHAFGNRDILIEKVWGKSALDKKYRDLFKKWHETLSKDGDKIEKFSIVVAEYVNVLRQDPGLPDDLLGQSWIGYEAMNIFKEIRSILLS
ncbi:MAG: PaaX family transcriptional regulator C-terminal domain-containing protein [Patescibacteria group bacterium]